MRKRYLTIGVIATSLFASAAQAHPRLETMTPSSGEKVAASPKEIRLRFNEPLVRDASGASLVSKSGKKIATGAPEHDGKDANELVIPLAKPLAAGRYEVKWHAVASDSHPMRGHYSFTVQR